MRRDRLVEVHVPRVLLVCATNLRQRPRLQALPVPDHREESVSVNFIGPLSEDHKYNMLVTMTDRLGADIRLAPCTSNLLTHDQS